MKYPNNSRWHYAWLQLICFFLGHKWKHVPSRRTVYADMENPPYKAPYWERIPWWRNKCARCRLRGEVDLWIPWYKTVWYGIKNAIRNAKFTFDYVLDHTNHADGTFILRLVCLLPLMCLHAWEGFFIHFDRLPWFLWTWADDVENWMYRKFDAH